MSFFPSVALPLAAALGVLLRERVMSDEQMLDFGVSEAWESLRHEAIQRPLDVLELFLTKLSDSRKHRRNMVAAASAPGELHDAPQIVGFLSARLCLDVVFESAAPATSLEVSASKHMGSNDQYSGEVGRLWCSALLQSCVDTLKADRGGAPADRGRQLSICTLLSSTLRSMREFTVRSTRRTAENSSADQDCPFSWFMLDFPQFAVHLLSDVCPALGIVAETEERRAPFVLPAAAAVTARWRCVPPNSGREEQQAESERRSLPSSNVSLLLVSLNRAILDVFASIASALIDHQRECSTSAAQASDQSPQKLGRARAHVVDMTLDQQLWNQLDVWQRALLRLGRWHEQHKSNGSGETPHELFFAAARCTTNFISDVLKKGRLKAEFDAHHGQVRAGTPGPWSMTLRLCYLLTSVSDAIGIPAVLSRARAPTLPTLKARLMRCAAHVGGVQVLEGPESDEVVCASFVRLACAALEAGRSVSNEQAMQLWGADTCATNAIHTALASRALRYKSKEVQAVASLLFHHMVRPHLSSSITGTASTALTRKGQAPRQRHSLELPIPQLFELLTERDATSTFACQVVADAALAHPHLVIPGLFSLLSTSTAVPAAPNDAVAAAAPGDMAQSARRNALEVLGLLPRRCLEGFPEVRARLAWELLQRLDDEILVDRLKAAELFVLADMEDIVEPLLVAAARPDDRGNRRSAATSALQACVAAHGPSAQQGTGTNTCRALLTLISACNRLLGRTRKPARAEAADPPAKQRALAPVTPRDLVELSQVGVAANAVMEGESHQSSPTTVEGERTHDRLLRLVVSLADHWADSIDSMRGRSDQVSAVVADLFKLYFQDLPNDELCTRVLSHVLPKVASLDCEAVAAALLAKMWEGEGVLWIHAAASPRKESEEVAAMRVIAPLLPLRMLPPALLSTNAASAPSASRLLCLLGSLTFGTVGVCGEAEGSAQNGGPRGAKSMLFSHVPSVGEDERYAFRHSCHPEAFRLAVEAVSRQAPREACSTAKLVMSAYLSDPQDPASTDIRLALFVFCVICGIASDGKQDDAFVADHTALSLLALDVATTILRQQADTPQQPRLHQRCSEPHIVPDEETMKLRRAAFDAFAVALICSADSDDISSVFTSLQSTLSSIIAFETRSDEEGEAAKQGQVALVLCELLQHASLVACKHRHARAVLYRTLSELSTGDHGLVRLANVFAAAALHGSQGEATALKFEVATAAASAIFNILACLNKTATAAGDVASVASGEDRDRTHRILTDFAKGCMRFSKHPPLQLEGVKLTAALLAHRADTFVLLGEIGARDVVAALEQLASISASHQARQLAEKVLAMLQQS